MFFYNFVKMFYGAKTIFTKENEKVSRFRLTFQRTCYLVKYYCVIFPRIKFFLLILNIFYRYRMGNTRDALALTGRYRGQQRTRGYQ